MFSSKLVGKKKHIDVATRKIEEIIPLIKESRPIFQGPYLKVFLETVTLKIMGIA
jgi:hypothetical protein